MLILGQKWVYVENGQNSPFLMIFGGFDQKVENDENDHFLVKYNRPLFLTLKITYFLDPKKSTSKIANFLEGVVFGPPNYLLLPLKWPFFRKMTLFGNVVSSDLGGNGVQKRVQKGTPQVAETRNLV